MRMSSLDTDQSDLCGRFNRQRTSPAATRSDRDLPHGSVTSSTLSDALLTFLASDTGHRLSCSGAMMRVGNAIREAEEEGVYTGKSKRADAATYKNKRSISHGLTLSLTHILRWGKR